MKLNVIDLGLCDYDEAYKFQLETLSKVQQGGPDTLILVEHPKVITLGRHANPENLIISRENMIKMGYTVRDIERGGDATYHGPGQLVGYTLFNIKDNHPKGIRQFVDDLEQVFIEMLSASYGLVGRRDSANSGVFIENAKIAAIGLAVKRGVGLHGFAFNVNTRLEDYQVIVPCGLQDKGVTSLKQALGHEVSMEACKNNLVSSICKVYKYTLNDSTTGGF